MQGDYAKNRRVAREFYRRARAAVDESGYPVHEVSGSKQRGDDFGSRLANAFADVFAEGYDRVIAVGSDCPRLHEIDWEHVASHLNQGRPVLGPTRGEEGAYLIGVSRSQFEKAAFAALPWKSASEFGAIRRYLNEQSERSPLLLDVRDDVNGHDDLVHLLDADPHGLRSFITELQFILGGAPQSKEDRSPRAQRWNRGPRPRSPPVAISAE